MKYNKDKRKFIRNFFLLSSIYIFPFSIFFSKKNYQKIYYLKKKFSKVWLLDINDS